MMEMISILSNGQDIIGQFFEKLERLKLRWKGWNWQRKIIHHDHRYRLVEIHPLDQCL
jgi:hypothetical protein